ncbi:IclR family transcriptional regulator domain-containing protein [Streptomyces sp. S465]|uniref:IclR family transcriptional regulator domain-containing protein n=1 Tax=Streptomyces sp. S465 TaxID=2979468 RepID=UPI0022A8A6D8|nr:IclR family transcriptional regulator C-terminal domain-containing protein [Streptomyces sp. S465]WAP58844.1 helix-turn-helix domain-containing protein [Streptomyces sp. S465]
MSFSPVPPHVNGPVGPLERGLAVLRELTRLAAHEGRTTVRPGDLVRGTGLARSVVDRVVGTLEQLGYVTLDGRDIGLAVRLMELGNAYLAASGLPGALGPFAERLADGLDESVSVAVPDGDGVRFVVQATRRRTMSLAFRIGDLLPAERCAPGALFATEWSEADWAAWHVRRAEDPLDATFPAVPPRPRPASDADVEAHVTADFQARVKETARDGWAADDQLIEPGLVAVSVPVRDASGRIVCAVNVVSHTSRHDVDSLRAMALGPLSAQLPAMAAAVAAPPPYSAASAPSAASVPGASAPAPDGAPTAVGEDPARVAKRELGAGFLQSLARGLTVLRALGGAEGAPQDEAHAAGGAARGTSDSSGSLTGGQGEAGPGRGPADGARGRADGARGRADAGPYGGARRGGMTLSAVAEATGLARATARRSLLTLVERGYAEADGRVFRPLPRVLELGYAPLADLGFTEIAQPHMRELVRTVHESASLAVLDGGDIRYIARVPTVRIMSVNITIGTRFPAYATSMGRVLLAGLDADARAAHLAGVEPRPLTRHTVTSVPELARVVERAAADGYALVDQELEEGLRSLAVPVRDARGRVVAALNVATHAGRGAAESVRRDLLPALCAAAARIEADLATASAQHPLKSF